MGKLECVFIRLSLFYFFFPVTQNAKEQLLTLVTTNLQQALNGISQISFSSEENVSPKKPTSIPEVAKQRELSGTLEAKLDTKIKKPLSDAKCKELSGNDIFGPPPENLPRSLAAVRSLESKEKDMGEPAPRAVRTSVRVSNVSILLRTLLGDSICSISEFVCPLSLSCLLSKSLIFVCND